MRNILAFSHPERRTLFASLPPDSPKEREIKDTTLRNILNLLTGRTGTTLRTILPKNQGGRGALCAEFPTFLREKEELSAQRFLLS